MMPDGARQLAGRCESSHGPPGASGRLRDEATRRAVGRAKHDEFAPCSTDGVGRAPSYESTVGTSSRTVTPLLLGRKWCPRFAPYVLSLISLDCVTKSLA